MAIRTENSVASELSNKDWNISSRFWRWPLRITPKCEKVAVVNYDGNDSFIWKTIIVTHTGQVIRLDGKKQKAIKTLIGYVEANPAEFGMEPCNA